VIADLSVQLLGLVAEGELDATGVVMKGGVFDSFAGGFTDAGATTSRHRMSSVDLQLA
jgi:hypothetical protein